MAKITITIEDIPGAESRPGVTMSLTPDTGSPASPSEVTAAHLFAGLVWEKARQLADESYARGLALNPWFGGTDATKPTSH